MPDITLPNNLEAEASTLNAALVDSATKIFQTLTPEDFYHSKNKAVAETIITLLSENIPVDVVTIKDRLPKVSGIASHLASILESPYPSDIDHYCAVIKDKANRRSLIMKAEALKHAAMNEPEIDEAAEGVVTVLSEIQACQQSQQSQQKDNLSADVSKCQQMSAECQQVSAGSAPYNLSSNILEWVRNSSGSFTVAELDREFCLTTRKQKNARSTALKRIEKLNYIKVDSHFKGKYHILNKDLDIVDLDAPAEESFPIELPLDIHKKVVIPPNSIILLAGSSNAGKTSFCLNTLWLNRNKDYKKLYLMSEMGSGEYVTRIKRFGPKYEWKNITAAARSFDFEGAVTHHNQSGLTVIDYLEETAGEYFKIPSAIRGIYDALKDGVALVAIQKASNADFGRGGEGTLEKSRLYMTIDYLATGKHSIICALKLKKIKNYIGENLQGFEIHFRLSEGHKIDPLTNWMHESKIDRDSYKRKYAQEIDRLPERVDPGDIMLTMKDGSIKRITEKTARQWQEEFNAVDVFGELRRLERETKQQSWLNQDKSGYIFQLRSIFDKEQKKIEDAS